MKRLTLLILFGYAVTGFGQERIISGRVTAEGEPVAFAHIFIENQNIGTSSNQEGFYELSNVPAEEFTLVVSAIGYKTYRKRVPETTDRSTRIDFNLQPSSAQLEEVVLVDEQTGLTRRTPYNVSTINLSGIENRGDPGGIMGSLREEPGVYGAEFGQGIVKPFIRGLGFSRIVTVFQGNKLENHQWGADHGLGINDLGVKRVDIIKGPASVLYGSGALGGVLIVQDDDQYLRKEGFSGKIGTTYNSVSNGIRTYASAGGTIKDHFFISADAAHESHADYLDGTGRTIGNSRFTTSTMRLHAGITREQFRNRLSFTYHRQNLGIIDDREMEEEHSLATRRNDREMQLPYQKVSDYLLSYLQTTHGEIFDTSFHLSHHFNDRKEIEENFELTDLGLKQDHTFYNARLSFSTGKLRHNLGSQGSLLQNRNMEHALDFLIPDARTFETGAYYLGSLETGPYFFQAALRYDWRRVEADASSQALVSYGFTLPGDPENRRLHRSFSGFTGSIGATRSIDDQNLLKFNFSTGFRAPDLAELFSYGPHPGTSRFEQGNADFKREQSLQADLSYTYHHNRLQATISAFGTLIDNYIYFSATDQEAPRDDLELWAYQQTIARFHGFEFELKHTWLKEDRLETKLTGAIVRSKDSEADRDLTFIPPDHYAFELGYFGLDDRTLHLFSRLRLTDRQDKTGPNEEATAGYALWNLGLSKEFVLGKRSVSTGLSLHNALNKTYVDHMSILRAFNVPAPGRNIRISLNFSF